MISSLMGQFLLYNMAIKIFVTLGKSIKTQTQGSNFPLYLKNYCVELLAVVVFYLPQYVLHHIEVSFFCPEVLLNHHAAKCCFYLVQLCCDWQVYVNVHLLEFGNTAYARCDLLFGAQKSSTANTINHLLVQNITSLNVCLCHFWPP